MYGVRPACWLKNSAFLGYSSASETDIAGVASLEIADESEAIPWGSLSSRRGAIPTTAACSHPEYEEDVHSVPSGS